MQENAGKDIERIRIDDRTGVIMSNEQKKYWTDDPEMVERYVLGAFSAEEMARMDAEIADHQPGKDLLHGEMEIAAGVRRHGRDRMKAELRKRLNRERTSQFYSYQYIGMAAAVLMIAVGIGLYQIWFSDLVAPKKFHQQQIVIHSQQDTNRTAGDESPRHEDSKDVQTADRSAVIQKHDRSAALRDKQLAESETIADNTKETAVSEKVATASAPVVSAERTASGVAAASSQVWLIGNVVMISEAAGASAERSDASPTMKQNSRRSSASGESIALQKTKQNSVIVRRRSMKELPADRGQSPRAIGQVETLLEREAENIVLTLYDDAMDETDVKQAVVESFSENTLVVILPHQRITYQLPSGWDQSSRSR